MRMLLLIPAMLALPLALAPALLLSASAETRPARPPSEAQAAQQQRMRQCNTDARTNNLSGDARREFMRRCLARHEGGTPAPAN